MALLTALLVLSFIAAMYMAWTIGANDVANAMGTSVGSGAISLKRAIIIAGVFDFLGALLVGGHVSTTIKGGIFDPSAFSDNIYIVYGMFAALLGTAIFITVATYFSIPVSTSHGIVGGIVGFAVTSSLLNFIEFSDISGMKLVEIVISWLVSPVAGGIFAFITFYIVKRYIMHANKPILAVKKLIPIFVGVVLTILALSIIYKGLKNLGLGDELPPLTAFTICIAIGFIGILITVLLVKKVKLRDKETEVDLIERIFGYLLILTASYIAFAHGANDVANAIGPFAAVISIYNNPTVGIDPSSTIPIWVLFVGGIAIIIGISTWGYKVIETMGRKITKITPSRGFAATFGAATSVLICSRLGMPVSTSHCAVGGVVGVGFVKGAGSIDFRVLKKIGLSWVITIPAAALLTVVIFLLLLALTL